MTVPAIAVLSAAGKATFDGEQVDRLQRAGRTIFHQVSGALTSDELAELLDGASVAGLTPLAVPRLGSEIIAELPSSVRGIAVFATGVDFIDLAALQAGGIALRRLPGYSTTSVAEHTIGLLLTMSRRLHLSRDRVLGRVPPGTSVRGWELAGKTLGVVGVGRIGRRVAALAEAFDMRVVSTDVREHEDPAAGRRALAEVLGASDVVTLHASTTWDAGPLIGEEELCAMRTGACLLNASRASLADERAVAEAVRKGRLVGYAVDDRLGDDVRAQAESLLAEGRIIETGHTAWYSQEALDRGTQAWVDNLLDLATAQSRSQGGAGA